MENDKESLVNMLVDWFGLNDRDGTYFYNLTRVKEAFGYGTMTLDDFTEVEYDQVAELADEVLKWIEGGRRENKTQ